MEVQGSVGKSPEPYYDDGQVTLYLGECASIMRLCVDDADCIVTDPPYKDPPVTLDATPRTVRRKQRPPHTGHIEAGSYTSEDGGPRLMRSVLQVRSEHGRAVHPTQKPLGILRPLIQYSCPPGAIVLDPFAGSGSTLLAARDLGRRAIGIEAREDYCEAAVRRLAQGVLDAA